MADNFTTNNPFSNGFVGLLNDENKEFQARVNLFSLNLLDGLEMLEIALGDTFRQRYGFSVQNAARYRKELHADHLHYVAHERRQFVIKEATEFLKLERDINATEEQQKWFAKLKSPKNWLRPKQC